ncbi:MAG: 4-alpha-glucanotransferase [Elusimicrobiota bacterium]
MTKRGSGVLLHITSLPSPYGVGDMGPEAYKFVDFLTQAKQKFWQILPLNPTDQACGNSPYSSISTFAGNPLLISIEFMLTDGFLEKNDLESLPQFSNEKVDFSAVVNYKQKIFDLAFQQFKGKDNKYDYENFCLEHSDWLDNFALFVALKSNFGGKAFSEWPKELRDRLPKSLQAVKNKFKERIEREKFLQYIFFKQWFSLKNYCNKNGVKLVGDVPIYVNYDSVSVWTNPQYFKLNEDKQLTHLAGVPPDYFSQTGQLWGNPVYRWDVLKESGYRWWIQRMTHNLNLFDLVRIDHFRGFVAYWEVPAGEQTAVNGKWVEAPSKDFFSTLCKRFSSLPIIAEDLGNITDEVRDVMHYFAFPGMKLLLFAFGENLPEHPYLPHNYNHHCVVYTGTHDNNTVRGWFEKDIAEEDKRRLFDYLGQEVSAENVPWELIRLAMQSVANMVIIPLQDILGLGDDARINRPATLNDNWRWRVLPEQLNSSIAAKLLKITEIYGRASR